MAEMEHYDITSQSKQLLFQWSVLPFKNVSYLRGQSLGLEQFVICYQNQNEDKRS